MALRCYECNSENNANCGDDGYTEQARVCKKRINVSLKYFIIYLL